MGAKIFTGTWDVSQCSNYCDAQTKYNLATAPKDGTPAKVCKFFNTYLLQAKLANGTIVPQGQYCSLYTEAWSSTYAVNGGQWRGQDQYTVDYSFGYAKIASSSDVSPTVGYTSGAVYQARQDMTYSPSSLTAVFQPFCSSLLKYTSPVASATALTTTTPVVTSTVFSTTTAAANAKRAASSLSVPAVLTKYPASVYASACSLIVTSPTVTSTTTVATSIVTAAASTTVVTSVSTVAAAAAPTCTVAAGDTFGELCNDGSSCKTTGSCSIQPSLDACLDTIFADATVIGGSYYNNNGHCEAFFDCCGASGEQFKLRARDTTYTNATGMEIPGAVVYIKPGVTILGTD